MTLLISNKILIFPKPHTWHIRMYTIFHNFGNRVFVPMIIIMEFVRFLVFPCPHLCHTSNLNIQHVLHFCFFWTIPQSPLCSQHFFLIFLLKFCWSRPHTHDITLMVFHCSTLIYHMYQCNNAKEISKKNSINVQTAAGNCCSNNSIFAIKFIYIRKYTCVNQVVNDAVQYATRNSVERMYLYNVVMNDINFEYSKFRCNYFLF